jgi:hypothetical protein
MKTHYGSLVDASQSDRADSREKAHSKKYPKKSVKNYF